MNIIQLQLWLEVCPFDNSLILKIKNEHEVRRKDKQFFNSIFEAIENKYNHTGYGLELKPSESRESIIEALLDFQDSLFLDSYIDYTDGDISIQELSIKRGADIYLTKYDFYDANTRIITLTKFEGAKE